jgi:hypothetical protein
MDKMSTTTSILTAPIGTKVSSANLGADVTVVGRTWNPGTTVADLQSGKPADEVTVSADGKRWFSAWHSGASADATYVERVDATGVVFHGWVDVDSRKIVQAG